MGIWNRDEQSSVPLTLNIASPTLTTSAQFWHGAVDWNSSLPFISSSGGMKKRRRHVKKSAAEIGGGEDVGLYQNRGKERLDEAAGRAEVNSLL